MSADEDLALQRELLDGVSRTFALTIPALPDRLEQVVGNAYLLCRITDTIEDAANLNPAEQAEFCEQFIGLVKGEGDADAFAREFSQHLAAHASSDEQRLIRETRRVLAITARFSDEERAALADCVAVMGRGMVKFQRKKSVAGLTDLAEHNEYCYVVAGCVGQMLTRLFIEYLPELAPKREALMRLSVSFGQCLQMTNILKDFWEDRANNACWMPRDIFLEEGLDLAEVQPGDARFAQACKRLLGIVRRHDDNALAYTLMLPARETQIRNFCLWALYMAVLTQRKILSRLDFAHGAEVKISRRSVKLSVAWSRFAANKDGALKASYALVARSLPRDEKIEPKSPAGALQ